MQRRDATFWVPYSALALLVAVRLLPYLVGFQPLWGVAQLTLLPTSYLVVFCALAAIALLLPFVPQSAHWGEVTANSVNGVLFDSKRNLSFRVLVTAGFGFLFAAFPMTTHFLGDGYSYIANLGNPSGHWIKWSEGGTMAAVRQIEFLMGKVDQATAATAFRIISILSGVVTIWFFLLIARDISTNPIRRLLTFIGLAITPAMLLFFGYTETYPMLWAPTSAFFYFGMRYANDGKYLLWVVVSLVLAAVAHLQAFLFYPAFLFLLFTRGGARRFFDRFRVIMLALLGAGIVGFVILFYKKFTTDLYVENLFLRPFAGKPIDPDYAMFSKQHLLDMFGLWLLVAPLGLVIAAVAFKNCRSLWRNATAAFFGLLAAACLLFLVAIDPSLTMPRDWDLFAICVFTPGVLGLILVTDKRVETLKPMIIPLLLGAVIFTLPYLLVNLNEPRAVEYAKTFVDNFPKKSMGSMSLIGNYYHYGGDHRHHDSVEIRMQKTYPWLYVMRMARKALADGDRATAERLAPQVRVDKFWKDYHLFWAELFLTQKSIDSALAHAKAAVQLQKYYDQGYFTLGYVYMVRQELDNALAAFRTGYALNNKYPRIMFNMATIFEWYNLHDSALYYCEKTVAVDTTYQGQVAWLESRAYYHLGDRQRALELGRKYVEYAKNRPQFHDLRDQLIDLMPELKAAVGN